MAEERLAKLETTREQPTAKQPL